MSAWRPWLVAATVLSGAAALIYETVWTRSFAIILGSTVEAAAATFAAFLVGLALGAYLFGRRNPPLAWTVRAYLGVEIAIAVAAPLIGLLIHRNADAWAVWVTAWTTSSYRVVAGFGTVLALVLLPTLLMGATFPLLLLAARRLGGGLAAIGRFYAWNTFGAALGTLACGFFLIRLYGVTSSLWIAAALNVVSAFCCLPLLRRPLRREEATEAPRPAAAGLPRGLLLATAAGSGFMVLALEIVWARLGSYFLGNRTFAFTTLLACVLVLLALGSWLAARLVRRFEDRLYALFGWTLTAAAFFAVATAAAAWWWIGVQQSWERRLPAADSLLLFYRGLETFLLLAPLLLVLGCLFPMSLMATRPSREGTARAAGTFYLVNTLGAVAGSLAVGFWGVSTLGAFGSTIAVAFLGGVLALAVFGLAFWRERRRAHLAGLVATTLVLHLTTTLLPPQLTLLAEGEELLFRKEDEYGVFQVTRRPDGLIKVTNNRTELIYFLGLVATSYVQEMQGHLGMFYQPEARSALVLGSGYGVTAGALTRYPRLERIDAVEIVPGMVEAAALFEPYNHGYHRDPRVNLVVDDGRHFLAAGDATYDIVSINVSDPHLPGGSSLFHVDFYDTVKQRLNAGGVVIQHAFGSDVDIVLRTLLASFEHVKLFRAYGNGYNVVAADHPLTFDAAAVDGLLEADGVRQSLRTIGLLEPLAPSDLLATAIDREVVERSLPHGPVATDDFPALEFAWSARPSLVLFSNE